MRSIGVVCVGITSHSLANRIADCKECLLIGALQISHVSQRSYVSQLELWFIRVATSRPIPLFV